MKSRDMLKLVQASNKSLSREKILKAMGSKNEFLATDVNWIIKNLQGQDAQPEQIKNQSDTLEFAQVNQHMQKIAREEGITYKPLNLIKVMNMPKFASFVAKKSPLKFYKNILAVSDLVLGSLKEF